MNDKTVQHLVKVVCRRTTQLRSLTLSNCSVFGGAPHAPTSNVSNSRITDVGLEHIAAALGSLTSFSIGNASSITDRGIDLLAESLPNFTALNIEGCQKLTNAAVQTICEKLEKLRSLNLSGLKLLTDSGLEQLDNLKHLTDLDISHCPNLTAESSSRLATLYLV